MIEINSSNYWFKVVEFLQQNWALTNLNQDSSVTVFFINDASGVFDRMTFSCEADAHQGLRLNGFKPLSEDAEAQKIISAPGVPFSDANHPSGQIYSSGEYWKS